MATLFWLQTGACGGDSLALLSAESPSLEQLFSAHGVELLWHPSLSGASMREHDALLERIVNGTKTLDMLCVEGSIVTAPRGTGLYDSYQGRARMDIARELAERAGTVVAMGTCAAYGGVHAATPNPGDCIGLQYNRSAPGGLLPPGTLSACFKGPSVTPYTRLACLTLNYTFRTSNFGSALADTGVLGRFLLLGNRSCVALIHAHNTVLFFNFPGRARLALRYAYKLVTPSSNMG